MANMVDEHNRFESIAVVGGGVAGMAAAVSLADAGDSVELFERRAYLGGRASSYVHPSLNEIIDCQHVLLGCCTNLIDLYARMGATSAIRWYDELTFLEPGGRASRFSSSLLPAPAHFSPSFMRASMLRLKDKAAIARGLSHFLRGIPGDDSESLATWLQSTGQTETAIKHFWEPVVLCTMNDGVAECSTQAAAHVFRELFLKSTVGGKLGIPTIPLSELYAGVIQNLQSHGGQVHLRAGVDSLSRTKDGRWALSTSTETRIFDAVVLALPSEQLRQLLPGMGPREGSLDEQITHVVHSPYTTVHLWFDRQVTDLPHAALLDTTIQWMFHKSKIRSYAEERGSYIELVIAASRAQLKMERQQILSSALAELALFFPEVQKATLLKSAILKEARATFSVLPKFEQYRPKASTAWPGIFLAGDWTSTGWPATMESATRSGYLAAEALTAAAGGPRNFLLPDVPASGLMRLID